MRYEERDDHLASETIRRRGRIWARARRRGAAVIHVAAHPSTGYVAWAWGDDIHVLTCEGTRREQVMFAIDHAGQTIAGKDLAVHTAVKLEANLERYGIELRHSVCPTERLERVIGRCGRIGIESGVYTQDTMFDAMRHELKRMNVDEQLAERALAAKRRDSQRSMEDMSLWTRGVHGTLVACDGSYDHERGVGACAYRWASGGDTVVVREARSSFDCELYAARTALVGTTGDCTLVLDCKELAEVLDILFAHGVVRHKSAVRGPMVPVWRELSQAAQGRVVRTGWTPGHSKSKTHPLLAECDVAARELVRSVVRQTKLVAA